MNRRPIADNAVNELIQYAVTDGKFGNMLIAAGERGICAIHFVDVAPSGQIQNQLINQLRCQLPHATLVAGDDKFCKTVSQQHIAAPQSGNNLPLDIRGSDFQKRVWRALQQILPGTTASYSAIAQTIGKPRAARAVAAACAKNTIAVLIPCHRAIGKNGDLCGYRWGINRKQKILTAEAAAQ